MRLAQLPTTRQTRHTLLHYPRPRIRAAARQLNSKRIQCSTPPPPQGVGGTPSHRPNTHLRQMRTTSHSHRPMGPRPHRQQTKLDRTRTQTLQQTRRPTQSNRKHRTLEPTLSQAEPQARRKPQASANANRTRHDTNEPNTKPQAKQAHTTKTTKHTPNRKKYNQPTRQHP